MKVFFLVLLIIHGMIHLMGFVKGMNIANISQLTHNISRLTGFFWLLAAILFIATSVLYSFEMDLWLIIGAAA